MNKVAVAVASDSSVTMSTSAKILRSYPTAEKILPLDLPHRVAVLHSGSTELLRVPYAVLLGEWKRSLERPLDRVSDYARSFSDWVEQQTGLFDDANQSHFLEWMLRDYFLAGMPAQQSHWAAGVRREQPSGYRDTAARPLDPAGSSAACRY